MRATYYVVDPSNVIGLYPDLLPRNFRDQLRYPSGVPELTTSEREKAMLALIEYLTQVSVVGGWSEEAQW